jgi:hypothetical protein
MCRMTCELDQLILLNYEVRFSCAAAAEPKPAAIS